MNLVELLYEMKRIRMVEEAIATNYNNDIREMHTPIHLCDGQEAVAVGVCSHLCNEDVIFSNHRCHGHYLAKGGNLNAMIAELYNKETGCCKGHGGSMHLMDKEHGVALTSAIVAGNVSIGTGYAMAQKMRKENHVSIVFMGDGATEEGSVYESICFAKLMNLPVIYVCENNQFAIDTPLCKREPNKDIASKFKNILPTSKIDGNNIVAVYETAGQAIGNAKDGLGPCFIECETYRYRAHHNVGNGIEGKYRTKEEVDYWMEKCPIEKLQRILLEENQVTIEKISSIEKKIQNEIGEAFAFAHESACPNSHELYSGLWG